MLIAAIVAMMVIFYIVVVVSWLPFIQATCAVDLTLQAETGGSAIVDACISKISTSGVFTTNDQQMLRHIAYVETHYGTDNHTYSNASNDGGIWQLSSAKYNATKDSSNLTINSLIQKISAEFEITWTSTEWSDLRKPFYSAIAARLYLEVITASIPLASNSASQGTYWATYYTTSGGTQSDYVTAVNDLDGQGMHAWLFHVFTFHASYRM